MNLDLWALLEGHYFRAASPFSIALVVRAVAYSQRRFRRNQCQTSHVASSSVKVKVVEVAALAALFVSDTVSD